MNDELQKQIDEASRLAENVLCDDPEVYDSHRLAEAVKAICGALQNIKHDLEIR